VKRREGDGIYDDHERRRPGTPPMITALEVGVGFLLTAALVTAVAVLSARRLGVMASRDEDQREVEGGRADAIQLRSARLPPDVPYWPASSKGLRMIRRVALLLVACALAVSSPAASETKFTVDPEAGKNTFSAVFDAAVGERITAVSSAVGCTLSVDEAKLEGKATCTVPLTSIRVDNDDTKSDHFRQWATNKKLDPKKCSFKLELPGLKVDGAVEPMKPVPFETEGTFTICSRPRDDGGAEKISGTIIYRPAGSYNNVRTLRVRAKIEGFNRERYLIGPKWTEGWLARVQQLAPVVATDGTIDVNVFATEPGTK
jgi:hypothetical protein